MVGVLNLFHKKAFSRRRLKRIVQRLETFLKAKEDITLERNICVFDKQKERTTGMAQRPARPAKTIWSLK